MPRKMEKVREQIIKNTEDKESQEIMELSLEKRRKMKVMMTTFKLLEIKKLELRKLDKPIPIVTKRKNLEEEADSEALEFKEEVKEEEEVFSKTQPKEQNDHYFLKCKFLYQPWA